MPPKPLSLPPKLLQQIGASEQAGASKARGRWKSQDQNRKDRRKAERQSRKQRQNPTRREGRPPKRQVEDDDDDDIDDNDLFDDNQAPAEPRKPSKVNSKKRKRDLNGDDEDGETPAPKQPSRAVRDRLAKDDAEIEQLERKLGLKKGRKSLPKSFKDDGLDDLLGELSGGSDSESAGRQNNEFKDWLAQKRREAAGTRPATAQDSESDQDDELGGWDSELLHDDDDDDDDEADDTDLGDDGEGAGSQSSDDDIEDEDVISDAEPFEGLDLEEETEAAAAAVAPKRIRENPYLPPVTASTQPTKYIPPSMRANMGVDADLEAQIRRKLQGPVNRVTEANLLPIVGEIERAYRDHPRGHMNNILTGLLMAQICDPTSKPDTLLVLSAGFMAALYKGIGIDFAAHFLTTCVERFQEEMERATMAAEEQRIPTKETSNLITVLAEMYIFRVISSNLMFDLVRLMLGDLSELNAELLLRIVRVAGPQLRKDDPLALKDIVSLIRPAIAKIGESNLTVRTKFMIETISDLKNNKLKAGAQDLVILNEHVTRMKKALGSLDTQKLKATEPLRIGLRDIENADKTGKWWLVGASWAGSDAQKTKHEDHQAVVKNAGVDEDKDGGVVVSDANDLVTPDYGQLAREQGMNTDIRRAIFIALVAAADYQDAYMRILKLKLNKYNRREVPNVLVQCCGAQQHYNPYYTLVARKFCSDSRIKYAFQDTVWTLFRRLGEPLFGEEPEEEEEEAADDRRLINTAKMIGSLAADGSVSLGLLKALNLAYIKDTTGLFVEVMLITVLQECSRAKNKTLDQALSVPFGGGLAPELARSVAYFLRKKVRDTDLVDGKKDTKRVKQACKAAEQMLQKPAQAVDL